VNDWIPAYRGKVVYLSSRVECPGRGHRVAPNDQDPFTTDAASYTRRTESSASSLREHQNSNTHDSYCGITQSYLKVLHRPLLLEISAYKHVVAGTFLHYFFFLKYTLISILIKQDSTRATSCSFVTYWALERIRYRCLFGATSERVER